MGPRSQTINEILYFTPFFFAPLSLMSSLYVSSQIITSKRKSVGGSLSTAMQKLKPKDHLLVGLCVLDMCGSFGFSFSTTPAMKEIDDDTYPTYGTLGTCVAQGFFVQMGISTPMYNAALCIYYLLSIRYKISDKDLAKKYFFVPITHFIILSSAFGMAISGISLKLYNFAGAMGCWIHGGPRECDILGIDPCDRGTRAAEFSMYFGLVPVGTCFAIVVISMIVLYCTVKGIEKKSRQWSFRATSPTTTTATTGSSEMDQTRVRRTALPLTTRTAETGMLYSISFLLVYLPTAILNFLPASLQYKQDYAHPIYVTFLILNAIFLPLQGFLNMLIYTSPKWLKWLHDERRRQQGGNPDEHPGLLYTIISCCCCGFICCGKEEHVLTTSIMLERSRWNETNPSGRIGGSTLNGTASAQLGTIDSGMSKTLSGMEEADLEPSNALSGRPESSTHQIESSSFRQSGAFSINTPAEDIAKNGRAMASTSTTMPMGSNEDMKIMESQDGAVSTPIVYSTQRDQSNERNQSNEAIESSSEKPLETSLSGQSLHTLNGRNEAPSFSINMDGSIREV